MATSIHLNFGDIVFSSAVERITVQTAASAVDISLHILDGIGGENLVFSETYYPYSGTVALHDFASVIEAEMVQWAQPLSTFRLTAKAVDGTSDTRTFAVLYCDRHTDIQPGAIVGQQFLTSRRIITASPDIPLPLFYIRPPLEYLDRELIAYHIITRCADTHALRIIFSPEGYTGYGKDYALGMLTVHRAALYEKTAKYYNAVPYEILGVTVEIGRRSITIYYSDRRPDLRLWFANMFNCPELAELHGDTTAKTKVKRSEAVCADTLRLYDQSVEQQYEFQADALSADTADWLTQLFTSRDVRIIDRPYNEEDHLNESFPSVLITDSTSEVQDGDDELNKIKFTYRHASVRPDSRLRLSDRIHNDTFKNHFT